MVDPEKKCKTLESKIPKQCSKEIKCFTITSNTIAPLEVLKPWHVLVTVDKRGGAAGMDGVCMVKVENNFENWKNKSISVYILGMLGPLVEGAVNGMHTVNVRHYNNKQHRTHTRGGACVGSGQEWVGLREWDSVL